VVAEHAAPRPGDVPHSLADVSLAERELGYVPATGLREGLRRTLETFEVPASAEA
jgi:UDP-glucose 4-epimerase